MYNRYIPQPDGSFHRSRMEDRSHPPEPPKLEPCPPNPEPCHEEPKVKPSAPCPQPRPSRPCRTAHRKPEPEQTGIGSFLRQLLPKDFDTADLIVVLLLLLMSSDGSDDNSALLTLALYLFM